MRARRRPLPNDDVELVVLQRRVQLLFQDRLQPVNLIEEQHLPFAQVRQNGCQVALYLQRGSAGLLKAHAKLVRNDGGERRFAQSRRTEQQHVIECLAAAFRGFECDGELLLRLGLTDELAQLRRPQLQLKRGIFAHAAGAHQPLGIGALRGAISVKTLLVQEVHLGRWYGEDGSEAI